MSISFRSRRREPKQASFTQWVIVAAVFLIVLVALYLVGGSSGPLEGGATADGRVTSVTDPPGNSDCSVTAAFNVAGQPYTATSSSGGLCGFEVGATVNVSYRPDDPTDNRIVTSQGGRRIWVVVLVAGMIVAFVVVAAVQKRRHRPQPERMGTRRPHQRESVPPTNTSGAVFSGPIFNDAVTVTNATEPQEPDNLPLPSAPERAERRAVPPGWYVDPDGHGYRWWDGRTWTEHEWTPNPENRETGIQETDSAQRP